MPPLPAYITAKIAARVPLGQSGVWSVIRQLRDFALDDLDSRVSMERNSIRDYLNRLTLAGYLTRLPAAPNQPHQWELTVDQAEPPRLKADGAPVDDRLGRGQENMWRAMKMLRDFDAAAIAQAASADGVNVAVTTANAYLLALHGAGYLLVIREPAKGLKGRTVYALAPSMNTGPQAPQIMRTKLVFDPNTRRIHDCGALAERCEP